MAVYAQRNDTSPKKDITIGRTQVTAVGIANTATRERNFPITIWPTVTGAVRISWSVLE